jgi:RNA polymerase sigma-70 factor, ECF subfamily
MDDGQLLQRSAAGDQTAFEILYERYRNMVFRFAWVLTRSGPNAEEVVQDSFMALIRKARDFDPKRAQLQTWLLGITRNFCYRRMRPEPVEDALSEDIPDDGASLETQLIGDEVAKAVRRAVMSLPRAQREAIVLFEFEDMSLAETAQVLGIEANAVKARLHRARELLRGSPHLSALLQRKTS